MSDERPRLVVTAGDPAGIGPEVVLRALADPHVRAAGPAPLVAGDRLQLERLAATLGLPPLSGADVLDVAIGDAVAPGAVGAASGAAAVATVRRALAAISEGRAAGLVTGPVSKTALRAAGHPWEGQSEMLAHLLGAEDLRVLLTGGGLTVAHVTAHRSLRDAIAGVTTFRVLRTIELAHAHGLALGLARPRIGVAGLNPHAGEGGLLGTEDGAQIAPAVEQALAAGIAVEGPVSADTLFTRAHAREVDIVVAMHHDQGHVPVKLLAHGRAVAMTLGLPILRTSPEHGAAAEIAGRGIADAGSMTEAVLLAMRLLTR